MTQLSLYASIPLCSLPKPATHAYVFLLTHILDANMEQNENAMYFAKNSNSPSTSCRL